MTQSLWVIRDRESGHYWNGFGLTALLREASMYSKPPEPDNTRWLPFPVDVLELRLIDTTRTQQLLDFIQVMDESK